MLQWRIRAIEVKPATQLTRPTVNVQVILTVRQYGIVGILDLVQVGLGCSQLGLHAGNATIVLKLCHDFLLSLKEEMRILRLVWIISDPAPSGKRTIPKDVRRTTYRQGKEDCKVKR